MLRLTRPELLKVLAEHVTALLKPLPGHALPVSDFLAAYLRHHGHSLDLQQYGVGDVSELVGMIPGVAKVPTVTHCNNSMLPFGK